MKEVHFIIVGLITWITLSFTNSIWVYKSGGHIIAACVVGLGSLVWLINKDNRAKLWTAFSSRNSMIDQSFANKLQTSIQVGSIIIFVFFVIVSEVSKGLVRQSEGYKYIVREVINNKVIQDQIGKIEYIAIGNSLSAGISFKDSEKRLRTTLSVFGISGQVRVDVSATKIDNWKIDFIKIKD